MCSELRLLTDYLTNRKQHVVYNNRCSDITDIVNGVYHELILGPLLFSIYIKGVIHTGNNCEFIMYADDSDTTIYLNSEVLVHDNVSNEINGKLEYTKKLQIN